MCRVIKVSSLGKKVKDFVTSFSGDGIVAVPEEKEKEDIQKEQETAWEQFINREPIFEEGGLW